LKRVKSYCCLSVRKEGEGPLGYGRPLRGVKKLYQKNLHYRYPDITCFNNMIGEKIKN